MKKVKILVADDHEIVRHGVENLINSEEDMEVSWSSTSGRDAVKLATKFNPDVVILDLGMPDLNGMDATRQIRKLCPNSKILIFTMHETERLVQEVFRAGAHAYVLKSDAGKFLLKAIRAVVAGEHFFSSRVNEVIFEGFLKSSVENPESETVPEGRLTARERETVQLIAEGKSNKEVATVLGISVKTAETHRSTLMRKLNLHSVSELVRYAIRNEIIQP